MQLTTHTDYALRLLIYLAVHDSLQPLTVQVAADHYGISGNHLAKVAQRLVQLEYVISRRGRNGGLELAMPAEQINIGELVRKTEVFCIVECFGTESACPIEPACLLKKVLADAQAAFIRVLDSYTIADITRDTAIIKLLLDERSG